ncbi:histidine phosphatase family protein [Nocardia sp. NPDC055053]
MDDSAVSSRVAQGRWGRLVLVRHGESEGNLGRLLSTRVPGPPLTERGVAQADRFAAALTNARRRLFCSTALRARQTAERIESVAGGPVTVLDGVYEVQAGDFEGLDSEAAHLAFHRIYQRWHHGELDVAMPGGETGRIVLERFSAALEDLRVRCLSPDEPAEVVLVSHGMAMRLVAGAVGGVPTSFAAGHRLDFTETIELVPRYGGGSRFLGWTCARWGRQVPPFGDRAR